MEAFYWMFKIVEAVFYVVVVIWIVRGWKR